jgi:hypothetical protein
LTKNKTKMMNRFSIQIEKENPSPPPPPSPSRPIFTTENILFNLKDDEIFTEKSYAELYSLKPVESDNIIGSSFHYIEKYYKPSAKCGLDYLFKRIPILKWLPNYNLRKDLIPDIIGGITVGIVAFLQGLAYSLIVEIPAINGVYATFFNVLTYLLFGTSKHFSNGTYAIVSLMLLGPIRRYEGVWYPTAESLLTNETLEDDSIFISNTLATWSLFC